MGLEDLNEKLYGRDVHLDRAKEHTPFDPEEGAKADPNLGVQFQKKEEWQAPVQAPPIEPGIVFADISTRKRRKHIALFLGGLALVILIAGLVFKIHGMLFTEERVTLSISGPKDVASVEETTYTIVYTNDNYSKLNNASLILSYPETFHVSADSTMQVNGSRAEIALGEIPSKSKAQVFLKGKFYGSKGEHVNLKAALRYSPNNVSTQLEKSAQFTATVATSPLSLEITSPLELVTGQDVDYVFDYNNKSGISFTNVRIKAEYPDGFRFVGAEPDPSEGDSVWYVGNFDTNASGKIVIHGVLTGTQGESKRIHGMIGFFGGDGNFVAYGENERQTRMIASPLSVTQTVNQLTDIAVSPGDDLSYAIHYRNDGNFGVRDAIITVEIDPTLLDMSRLSLRNGAYDVARKIIVWKASDVPQLSRLEPGAEGSVDFNVPVMDKVDASNGKNLSIKTVAKIDSLDIPTPIGANKIIGSNTLLVRLKSSVDVATAVLYTDTAFPNSGPIPPKVGQETSYTVHLSVSNSLNDIKQSRLSIILPTGVHYNGKYAPTENTLSFNERSNELVWELGTFSATNGKSRDLAFQVSITPSPDQAKQQLTLVNSMVFTGKDTYTNQDIRVEKGNQKNFLKTDPVYGSLDVASMVQPAD